MAANKFARMLHKNCHKIIVILVYTLLEWILILLLLLNSSFSYLIRKFANFFGLRQSCTWCCALDHIFDPQKSANPQLDHVCAAHGAEISKLSYCSDHKRLAESNNLCTNCSSGTINDVSCTAAFFTWMSTEGMPANGEENRCSCCDVILTTKLYPSSLLFKPSWDILDYLHKKALSSQPDDDDINQRALDKESHVQSDAGQKTEEVVEEFECDDPFLNRSNEDDESVYLADMLLQNADYTDSDRFICIELIDSPGSTEDDVDGEVAAIQEPEDFPEEGSGQDDCVDEYMNRIKGQEEALKAVYEELEEERRAAEEGAKETMAMITKLQEEKAAIQMEAIQYQRMMEEQAEYDQEALQLLNDLMTKRDKEKKELEKELEIYRNKALDYEARENTPMIRTRNCVDGLECESEYDESLFGSHQKHNLDDSLEEIGEEKLSLAEFDDERVSILEEVKILEAKLFALHNDEMKISRNGSGLDDESIDVMTKKLLPLFDATENGNEFNEYDDDNHLSGRILVEEELSHVYERLQALEEDNDFLKHCIGSMIKGGNKGLILVQEILQHLRDLKSVELSATNMAAIDV